tara:strand:+ start:107 stop:607 length:501 start_codon:yes stop_codon:yes gene_type:complete
MRSIILLFVVIITMSCNYSKTDLKIENANSSVVESSQLEIEREIISVIDKFTEAINTKNPEIVSDILDSELDKIKYYVKNDSSYHKKSSSSLDFLKTSKNKYFEKYWDPIITTDGNIASVWAPYEFYLDDVFSHCGTNLFFLVKENKKWKILQYGYTIDKIHCENS